MAPKGNLEATGFGPLSGAPQECYTRPPAECVKPLFLLKFLGGGGEGGILPRPTQAIASRRKHWHLRANEALVSSSPKDLFERHDPRPDDRIDPGLVSVRDQIGWPSQTAGQNMSKTIANSKSAPLKLTDAQTAMLNSASQREDRCLTLISSMRGAQVVKTAEKLITAGLVREVKAKASIPVWRRDGETGTAFALKLTAAGAKAIAGDGEMPSEDAAALKKSKLSAFVATGSSAPLANITHETAEPAVIERRERAEPRPNSKIASGHRNAFTTGRGDARGSHSGNRVASPYDARRPDRAAQARICRDARSIEE